jgi:hypothetical protein
MMKRRVKTASIVQFPQYQRQEWLLHLICGHLKSVAIVWKHSGGKGIVEGGLGKGIQMQACSVPRSADCKHCIPGRIEIGE